ncbi:PREDICTED: von Willebrand factor A domain-containing protein 2-like, partial [Acropora digitifera]|uniref:von Willebrand factor A domain-containing protein 2-like n=1 Tax=Acropora digitifera TaxID=70779 RepID=UPI00077AA48F
MGVRVVLVRIGSDALRSSLLPLVENKADLVIMNSFNDMMRNAVDLAKTTCNAALFPPCKLHADVAFLIDTSQNASKGYLTQQKNFAKILMRSFSGNWSFSIVTYGRNAIVKANLSQAHNLSYLEQTVDEIAHDKVDEGQVRLDKALDLAITDVFPRARPGVTKIDLIFTDGRVLNRSNSLEVIRSSEASKEAGVRLLTLGIGAGVDPNEWSRVGKYGKDLIYLRDSQDLTFKVRDIAATVCAAAEKIEKQICLVALDIAFVVDSSDHVNAVDFEKQKALLISIARKIGIMTNYTRGALVPYGDTASVYFRFEESSSIASFENAVAKMPRKKGRSSLVRALEVTRRDVFPSARAAIPQIAFVLSSDKQSGDAKALAVVSDSLRQKGVKLLEAGVENEANLQGMRSMTNNNDDVNPIQAHDQLSLKSTNLSLKICEAA